MPKIWNLFGTVHDALLQETSIEKQIHSQEGNSMISHSYEICFTFQDEVELQQDEENLPYEEEIYKDSSTFLKVSSFAIRRIGKGILLC